MNTYFDFIADDHSNKMPTPELIKAHIKFTTEENPDLTEAEYRLFSIMRKDIIDALADPYALTPFNDDTGEGYLFTLGTKVEPSEVVWDLLKTFVVCHDWETLTFDFTGKIYCKTKQHGSTVTSEYNDYMIKLYTQVGELDLVEEDN